jgi:rhamnosyltransferase
VHRPLASVIIRTKNEQKAIGATLDAVLSQRLRPHEVIVIDSGSTDSTLDITARYPDPVRIMTIPPAEWGYARALNRAAASATGEYLVCLSAHCLPIRPDWLEHLLRHFEDPRVAGTWGPNVRPGRPLPEAGPPLRQEPGTYDRTNWTWGLSNGNSAVRRTLWEQFPFDESMPAAEDKAWGREAMVRGYCIVHEPAAMVLHDTHSFLAAYRRQKAVNEGFAMMFPEPDSERRHQVARAGAAAWQLVRRHAEQRDARALWTDARRAPSSIAAVVGGLAARRRPR